MFKHVAWLIQGSGWGSRLVSAHSSQLLLLVRGQHPKNHCLEKSKAASERSTLHAMLGNPGPGLFRFQTYLLSLWERVKTKS